MPSPEKQVSTHVFTGGMDTVTAREHMTNDKARYILNCHVLSQGQGEVGVVTNVKGNVQINFPLPPGQNKCIGTASDEEQNKFYFFTWNSNDRHCIFQFNGVNKQVTKALENLIDTGNVDIMKLNKEFLILHADVVRNNLLYWVDGLNNERKTNVNKLFDNSDTGYGDVILQEFIDAYKRTADYAPVGTYFSDTSKPFNRFYGQLTKYAYRYIYDDGEKSSYTDFSAVVLPDKEPFTGINAIPTDNNGINITVNTGNRLVKRIELVMQSTTGEENNEGIMNWRLITTLDKKRLKLADNTTFVYKFYNDGNYPAVDQSEVIQPYSFMPKRPLCQAVSKRAITYSNGYEGFPIVDVDASINVTYSPLFIDNGTAPELNKPVFGISVNDNDFVRSGVPFTYFDGTVMTMKPSGAPSRFARHTITIGADVKKGNLFQLHLSNGSSEDTFDFYYEATLADSALTVANNIRQQLINTSRIYRKTPDIQESNIYDNTISGGNVSFSYIIKANKHNNYIGGYASVNPVNSDKLKDTGQSVKNIKMGSTIKLGIIYEDFDGRKSLTYTSDAMIVSIQPVNVDGIKVSKIMVQINHRPPIWAKFYQIVRTNDLKYGDFIQGLVQTAVEVQTTDNSQYLDLVIGSFDTFRKIHPNSALKYQFEKGDRIGLIKRTSNDTYYEFFETEAVSFSDVVRDNVQSNIKIDGTASVEVAESYEYNIGKFVSIEGSEREIVSVPDGTHYLLNNVIGNSGSPTTYLNYDLIDRRGTLRIRKPSSVVIENNSIIEVYKPSKSTQTDKTFFEFQKKFPIINPGTENAYHTGNPQSQSDVLPALVEISEGTIYVRNREMPVNNQFPGTQVVIGVVEDGSYSDFYPSLFNDNGRVNSEDTGQGEVHFGSRIWFSSNAIEDTSINGFNNFPNSNKVDYPDDYGNIKLTKFDTNRIYVFKDLKTAYVPVDSRMTQDDSGVALLVGSSNLLNPIQYFAWEGGIGNNPESYASNGTQKYFISANSGVIIRLGGNGEEPISKTYLMDNEIREILAQAINNKAKIFGSYDRKNGVYVITIEGYEKYIYFDGLTGWLQIPPVITSDVIFELVTSPSNGSIDFTSPRQWTYTPNLDYIGHDTWSYRAFINGQWTLPSNVCINVTEIANRVTGWRAKESSYVCSLDQYGLRTGLKSWTTLEQFYLDDNSPTGLEKPNDPSDPNYALPVQDETKCVPQPIKNIPDQFNFVDVIDAEVSTEYISNEIEVTNINIPVPLSISGFEYSVNGDPWESSNRNVVNGDKVRLKVLSSSLNLAQVSSTLTIGGVSDTYSVTTKDSNVIPIQEFDFMVLRYEWGAGAGTDLDTFTGFIGTGTIYDADYIGYGQGPNKVPDGATDPYLWWGSDNTGSGVEAILVDIKKFMIDFPSVPNIVNVIMNGVWYSTRLTGDITVSVVTYKGGTMNYDAPTYNFINTGGVQVDDISIPFNVVANNQLKDINNSTPIAILAYNKTTNTATLTLQ